MNRTKAVELLKIAVPQDESLDEDGLFIEAVSMAIEALEQPEIIRCRDCDWWTKQPDSLQGRCALSGTYPTGAFFCGNARKRGETDG